MTCRMTYVGNNAGLTSVIRNPTWKGGGGVIGLKMSKRKKTKKESGVFFERMRGRALYGYIVCCTYVNLYILGSARLFH